MELSTSYYLCIDDRAEAIEEGERIQVFLTNGEILIGKYDDSDNTSLNLERDNFDTVNIEFCIVKDIEKLD